MGTHLKTNTIKLKKLLEERNLKTISEISIKSGIKGEVVKKILDGSIQPSSCEMTQLLFVLKIESKKAGSIFFDDNLRNK
jgi:hypothetical protein